YKRNALVATLQSQRSSRDGRESGNVITTEELSNQFVRGAAHQRSAGRGGGADDEPTRDGAARAVPRDGLR
ncbi:unnamed protein product, partial [Closterium sp. NIES-53]